MRKRPSADATLKLPFCISLGNHLADAQELHLSRIADSSVAEDRTGHGYQSLSRNKQLAVVTAEYRKLIATQGNGDNSRVKHLSDGDRCYSRYEGLKRCAGYGRGGLGTNYQSLETVNDSEVN